MIAISSVLITRLLYVQLRQEETADSNISGTYQNTYREVASRGEIYDRNGTPLVTNLMGFVVEFDYHQWEKSQQNETILMICEILAEAEIEYNDSLPMSDKTPFTYTYSSRDSTAAKQLKTFVAAQGWADNPSAPELFSLLCDKYGVDRDLGLYQKRMLVGVRYYLDQCQFSGYNTPVSFASDIDIATVAKISSLGLQMPGVTIQVDDTRQIETTLAAHVLGRVAPISATEFDALKDSGYLLTDTIGRQGMEKALEEYLRGIDGEKKVEISKSTGETVSEYYISEPQPGSHCYLTLDMGLQAVAEQALADTIANVKASGERSYNKKGADIEGGALVVLHIETGEILAMASYPTYDLSRFGVDYNELLEDPLTPMYNRAVNGYPPGSTFKMVTAVAALEEGIVTTKDKIRDEGVYRYYETYQPRCWLYNNTGGNHGNINISEALKYSCNYFFYEVGRQMGIETLNKYGSALGFGSKTGVELPEETEGILDGPEFRVGTSEPWQPGNILAASIGQAGHKITPLQLANYMATILNSGTRYRPHLLKEVVDYTGTTTEKTVQPEVMYEMNISEITLDAVKAGMLGVVTEDGTASSYFRDFSRYAGFEVGGKTGSAETRKGRSAHGVFLSFAPYDQPEIVVVVIGEYAGSGGIMSPACIAIYDYYFNLDKNAANAVAEPPITTGSTGSTGSSAGNQSSGSSSSGSGSSTPPVTVEENEPPLTSETTEDPPATEENQTDEEETANGGSESDPSPETGGNTQTSDDPPPDENTDSGGGESSDSDSGD